MISDHTQHFKLEHTVGQVHQFCPALDNSFVVMALMKPGEDHLIHYNSEGKIISDHNFLDFM